MTHPMLEFIEGKVDELEQKARAATDGPWEVNDEQYPEYIRSHDGTEVVAGSSFGGEGGIFNEPEDAHHIAAWDPDVALRVIAGWRKVLDVISADLRDDQTNETALHMLRAVAAVWAGQQGWREEWA